MNNLREDLESYYGKKSKFLHETLTEAATDWGWRKDKLLQDFEKYFPNINHTNADGRKNFSPFKHYWLWASVLNKHYDIPFAVFQNNNGSEHLYKKLSSNAKSDIEVIRLKNLDQSKEDREKKEKVYKRTLIKFIEKSSKSLFVYDYLERQFFADDSRDFAQSYQEMHQEIYIRIKDWVFSENVDDDYEYIRLLVLPLRGKFSQLSNPSTEDLEKAVLKLCAPSLFEHICEMSKLSDRSERNVSFFMVAEPTRSYEYGLVDKGSYFISEYYRYSRSQQSKPDLLIIEDNKGAAEDVSNIYKDEIKKLRSDKNPILDIFYSQQILLSIIQEYEDRVEVAKNKLKAAIENQLRKQERKSLRDNLRLLERKLVESNQKLEIHKQHFPI